MSSPTRRPIKLRNTISQIERFLNHHGDEIRLGWSCLLDDLNAVGWPDRTPEDDRRPRPPADADAQPPEPDVLDYADPTGEMAMRRNRLDADREALEDHRNIVETSLRAMELIARRYRPPAIAAVPACSLTQCCEPVESYRLDGGSLGFRGMVLIAGVWVAKPGSRPLCTKHRKQQERRAS